MEIAILQGSPNKKRFVQHAGGQFCGRSQGGGAQCAYIRCRACENSSVLGLYKVRIRRAVRL